MKIVSTIAVLLVLLTCTVQCAKILVVFPFPAYSHFSLGFRLAKELADRGNQVTFINPYPQKSVIKNLKDVSTEDLIPYVEEMKKNLFNMNKFNPLQNILMMLEMGATTTEIILSNKNIQNLLNSAEKFDAVIMEYFISDALIGLSDHFKCPTILIAPGGSNSMNNHLFANPAPSSYVPNIMGSFNKHMNFWQRLQNLLSNVLNDATRELITMPKQRELFKKYFKTDLELDQVLYNVSLMLTNSHVSINDAVPRVPSIIEIGGFHVMPPKKLPDDLQKFLDESKQGAILFSLGSNLKSKDLKPEVRDGILQAFAKIKQNVLWKFEADLPNLPKNVKIMKWIPQQDVLAHPNIQAFISHGGLLSTIETVYHGVPIIGIPVFGDQKSNIASAAANGYAVSVPLDELSEQKLSWALTEVLNNPKYRENVKWRSRLIHDQPLKPLDTAIYWIEHVIRNKGAPHLRTAGLDLKWHERHMIDLIVFLVLATFIFIVSFYKIIKCVLKLCCRRKKLGISGSKKNK